MNNNKINNLLLVCSVFPTFYYSTVSHAADWRMMIGGHDFIVDQADSHTFGAGVGFYVSHTTKSDIFLGGRFNTYFDIDNDELDPDHIPIWFQSDFVAKGASESV